MEKEFINSKVGKDAISLINGTGKTNYYIFKNALQAIKLLSKHVKRNSRIIIHADVDFDGIASAFEMDRALKNLGCKNIAYCGNTDKVHGVKEKNVVNVINQHFNPDLIIIVDSSSNETEYIVESTCDILVIDHHETTQEKCTYGVCSDGEHEYVIINNNIENSNIELDKKTIEENYCINIEIEKNDESIKDMSCGVVVHELLELYYACIGRVKELYDMSLYQWAGMSLYTDSIDTLNKRNQWYVNMTIHKASIEPSLYKMIQSISKYNHRISKSLIEYKIAPIINKAIRADKIVEVIDKTIKHPEQFNELIVYKEEQEEALEKVKGIEVDENKGFIACDISKYGIKRNYNGVIAAKLLGDNGVSTAIYQLKDGTAVGSFRGKRSDIDYLSILKKEGIQCDGHPQAFGYSVEEGRLIEILEKIGNIDKTSEEKIYLSVGNLDTKDTGEFHFSNLDEFRKGGRLMILALYNSNVSSKNNITINISSRDITLQEYNEKYIIYDFFDIQCVAYERIDGNTAELYAEYGDEIKFYIRNKKGTKKGKRNI